MNIERLQHLITVLENVPAERFDLAEWQCGTTACAVGWAALDPVFNKQGLRLTEGPYGNPRPEYENDVNWPAVVGFFDLGYEDTIELFADYSYPEGATAQDVIARIKEKLE